MNKLYTLLALFSFHLSFGQLTPPAELQQYYADVNFSLTGEDLYDNLAVETIWHHINIISYANRHDYLYDMDQDLNIPENVVLIYSGESRYWEEYQSGNNPYQPQTFNTEHVYPNTYLSGAQSGDLHNLRVCDIQINNQRGNKPFTSGSGSYVNYSSSWFPGDEWTGDIARMMLYLNLRYNLDFDNVGTLALFLEWNANDPVSDFEDQRNAFISSAQGNRNPFIDNPYLATLIWGGPEAENRWTYVSTTQHTLEDISVFPNPVTRGSFSIETALPLNLQLFDILGKEVLTQEVSNGHKSVDINHLETGIYLLKLSNDNQTITKKLMKQ